MIDRAPVTEAVRRLIESSTKRPCGLAELPYVDGPSGLAPAEPPYTVLYPVGGSITGPPFGDSTADASYVYQLTIMAERADQAEWLTDRGRRALLERRPNGAWLNEIDLPGAAVMARQLVEDTGLHAEGTTVTSVLRVRLDLTPTA
ncbi:hypothetical protein [Embleya sp. NPDC059237]|uniref:hypothetical protein n=1 Tax=Embleya sp. NPDC059237 TaxID=3346784 RepID=UPI00368FD017